LDHDYELASYDRTTAHIHDKERLSKPISYWREIAPKKAAAEEAARNFAEEAKANKKAKRTAEASDEPEPALADQHARQLFYRGDSY
jgi:NADH-quinone oxidoreductase subunit I